MLPGARLPVDGEVLSGSSHADEAMLTGEAAPVPKRVGSAVIGGTMNLGGTLVVRPSSSSPATERHFPLSCWCSIGDLIWKVAVLGDIPGLLQVRGAVRSTVLVFSLSPHPLDIPRPARASEAVSCSARRACGKQGAS